MNKDPARYIPKSHANNYPDRRRHDLDDVNTDDFDIDDTENLDAEYNDTEDIPNHWEDRWWGPSISKARGATVRKPVIPEIPVIPKTWFGCDSSSEESDEDTSGWTNVDRKKKEEERRKRASYKKDNLKKRSRFESSQYAKYGSPSPGSL